MLILLFILIPLVGGGITLLLPASKASYTAIGISLLQFVVSLLTYTVYVKQLPGFDLHWNVNWIPSLGARFSLGLDNGDSLALMMLMLNALVFPIIFVSLLNKQPERKNVFYGLMLLAQAGLSGVFLAKDALLFYVCWEAALIPVYFLSSLYGGPRRIPVTFKFFVYTFAGSLLMLVAILLIYQQTPIHSFDWDSFVSVGRSMPASSQNWIFWLMFVAFAIKMPIFPFHTWQPDAYEESATPVTIVLSAIMVKMGLFAVVRWLMPVLPLGCERWMDWVTLLSVISIVYASCLALVQTNIKRIIAYSSIAHIGLMCAAIFSHQLIGMQGAAIQMFNHGIIITGMWLLVAIVENRLHTQDIREMGGIAKLSPWFTVSLVVASLANIGFQMTNGFVGEFMMFNGLFKSTSPYHIVFTVFAGTGIIVGAAYTLNMIQKVAYGDVKANTSSFTELSINEKIGMGIILLLIVVLGFYPKFLMDLIYVDQVFQP